MSSNRHGIPCNAYLERDDAPVGPLRLPSKAPQDFIDEFNRIYARIGMAILPVESPVPESHRGSIVKCEIPSVS